MQILKNQNREKIITMRIISEKAQMTVGNIYRYYKSKEELFATIVAPLYNKLTDEMKIMIHDNTPDIKQLVSKYKELQGQFCKEWVILFNGSTGTRFEKTVKKLEKVLQDSLRNALIKNNKNDELAQPLSKALMSGLTTILSDKQSDSQKTADNFIDYIVSGLS